MQQKQKKSEATSKKTSSVAKMMLQRDKERLKTQQKHAYIELLKAPRGKEYLRLLAETTRLCEQLSEVEDEIAKLEAELEQEAATLPASDALGQSAGQPKIQEESKQREESGLLKEGSQDKKEIEVIWKSQAVQETSEIQTQDRNELNVTWKSKTVQEVSETQAAKEQIQVSWKSQAVDTGARIKQFKEKQQRLAEMKRQREEMAEQFRTVMREFAATLPVPEKRVGLIWPSCNSSILMKYGIISCAGTSYNTPQELIGQVRPKSQQEERQWLKGDAAYRTHLCEELLVVEIYMEAVCVVYKDGSTHVIES